MKEVISKIAHSQKVDDNIPALLRSGEDRLVAGVPPQAPSQHRHDISGSRPLVVPVLPDRCWGRFASGAGRHSFCD